MFLLLQTQFRTLWAATLCLLMMRHPSTKHSQISSRRHHRNNYRFRMDFSRLNDPSDWTYYHPLLTQTPLENLLWYMKRLVLSRVTCDQLDVVAITRCGCCDSISRLCAGQIFRKACILLGSCEENERQNCNVQTDIKFNVGFLTPESGTNRLSRNVGGKKLPLLAVQQPRRAQFSNIK
jgi:hypothetical protein